MTAKSYVVIAGPTASGKSDLGMALAKALDGEIIACDSVQVYRGFDIGAAKPTPAERAQIPHHLLDCVDASASFDAGAYAVAAKAAIAGVASRGRLPIVVGGTGLYLRSLLGQGWHEDLPSDAALRQQLDQEPTAHLWAQLLALDPERASALHPHDRVRIRRSVELARLLGQPLRAAGLNASAPRDPAAFLVVLEPPRSVLHERIARRAEAMIAGGLLTEVAGLLALGVPASAKPMQSIGYKQAGDFSAGRIDRADLPQAIIAATRQYAKRQCTWFRKLDADLRLNGTESLAEVVGACRAAVARADVRLEQRL